MLVFMSRTILVLMTFLLEVIFSVKFWLQVVCFLKFNISLVQTLYNLIIGKMNTTV